MIDWTKPVQRYSRRRDEWYDAEVLKVFQDGAAALYDPLTDSVDEYVTNDAPYIRNTPQPKREYIVPDWATPGLTVEVGKSYRTRDGRKAEVTEYREGDDFPYRVTIDGIHYGTVLPCGAVWGAQGRDCADLIAEWVEPPSVWLNLYKAQDNKRLEVAEHKTRESADRAAAEERLACVRLAVSEGHVTCEVAKPEPVK